MRPAAAIWAAAFLPARKPGGQQERGLLVRAVRRSRGGRPDLHVCWKSGRVDRPPGPPQHRPGPVPPALRLAGGAFAHPFVDVAMGQQPGRQVARLGLQPHREQIRRPCVAHSALARPRPGHRQTKAGEPQRLRIAAGFPQEPRRRRVARNRSGDTFVESGQSIRQLGLEAAAWAGHAAPPSPSPQTPPQARDSPATGRTCPASQRA